MDFFLQKLTEEFQLPLQNPILVFCLILSIILLSPIILKRVNIPGIIGLILAGVVIGPHGLNILENNEAIKLFSTIGLLYIMFIAGLELDLNEFKANRNKSLVFGFFTFIIPLVMGFPAVYYILGYDFNASFLTASMFATHTLVAYPIVSRLGISKNQAVAITVGGTILTDTAVLIVLAVIMGNSRGELNMDFWIKLGLSLVIFTLVLFITIPRIAKWFFEKMESEKHLHFIFVLAVVFIAAFLAEIAGVEPIIGAFFAGLALNKLIPHESALMNRIEFIGNSLFIPFFLISVGMLVNTRVILSGPMALIIAGVLTIVALFSKYIAAWITQVFFRYTKAQRGVIFGLSGAHAAATLAVILVGYQADILDDNILNGTIILILITCVVASLVTEKSGKVLAVEVESDVEALLKSDPSSKEQILLSIDSVGNIERMLEMAILMKDATSPNPVTVLSVVSNDEEAEENVAKAKEELGNLINNAAISESEVDIRSTIDLDVFSGISRISRELMADFLILDWTNRNLKYESERIEDKVSLIRYKISKTTFICHLERPIHEHGKLIVIVPPNAELEPGFEEWLSKLSELAANLETSIFLYTNSKTEAAAKKTVKANKLKATINYLRFNNLGDLTQIDRNLNDNDIIVLVTSRKRGLSYHRELKTLHYRIEEKYPDYSQFIIFPKQEIVEDLEVQTEEEEEEERIGFIQRLGRRFKSIFS